MNAFSVRTWNWRRIPLGLWALSFALLVWGPLHAEDCRQELTENLHQLQLASECEKSPRKCARYTGLFGSSGPLLTVANLKVLIQLDKVPSATELPTLLELPTSAPTSKNKVLQGHYQPLVELYSRGIKPSSNVEKNCQRHLTNSRKALDWIYQKSKRRQLDCSRDKISFSPLEGPRIEVDLTNFSQGPLGDQNKDKKRPELSLLITEAAACCLRINNPRSPLTAPSPTHCERHFWDPDAKSPLVSASRGHGTKGSSGFSPPNDGQK